MGVADNHYSMLLHAQELKVDGVVNISDKYAQNTILGKVVAVGRMRAPESIGKSYNGDEELKRLELQTAKCNLLMNLDQTASLPFPLDAVAERCITYMVA